jgi:hypothetical protein
MLIEPEMVVTVPTRVKVDEVLPGQSVLVAGYVEGKYVGILTCEVGRPYGGREGVAMIGGRLRRVSQSFPNKDRSGPGWFLDDREGIGEVGERVAKE